MKLSVIMPVYNAADTLTRALRSVLTPPGEGAVPLELIAVDDGSGDASPAMLDAAAAQDSRLRVLRTPNGGPAAARNAGMAAATGDWVLFLDSDDAFADGFLPKLAAVLAQSPCQVVLFGFRQQDARGGTLAVYRPPAALHTTPQALGEALPALYAANHLNMVWNKAFSRALIQKHGLTFPPLRYGEDRVFALNALQAAGNCQVLDAVGYRYIMGNPNSLVSRYVPEKLDAVLENDKLVRQVAAGFGQASPQAARLFDGVLLKGLFACLTQLYHPTCPYQGRERRAQARAMLHDDRVPRALCPEGGLLRVLARLWKSKNTTLNLWCAWGMMQASRKASGVFVRAKKGG